MHSNSTNYDAMNSDGAADAPDQRFLDEVFERAVQLVEDGLVPETEALLAGHEALRAEVERLVQLARHVAVGAAAPLPALAGFTILQQLGQGGMGMVYLARQHSLGGRPVALKVLPNSAALSTRARARFLAEATAIARLRHPNIVAVHDVVHQGDVYAYAMEWVDGSSLADVIAREGTKGLGIPDVCQIGLSIARALEAVHTAGLLHRDVKPSNILLRRDGTPLLADFGLARELDSSVHTQAGLFAGTVAYAPPEQLRGDSPPPAGRGQGGGRQGDGSGVDTRSDIYALGVTLYQALALRLPFEGRNPTAMLRRIEAGAATPLRKLNPRVPRDLETIVAKAMEADPARRYQTAGDFATDLERFMNYQPIQARPAGLLTRGVKLVRRNRGAALGLTLGSVITLALAAAAVTYVFFLPGWVADHVREARLTLLDPGQATNIVSTIYWGRINPGGDAHWEARRQVLRQALVHYDRALRLTPRDESIRREREVVARASREVYENSDGATKRRSDADEAGARIPSRTNRGRNPFLRSDATTRPWEGIPTDARARRDSRTSKSDASSLRDDALYAFLTHDYPTAIAKWSAWEQSRDPLLEPDPLVDAALGVLYLFDEQPGRAYPRLQKAAEAFPGVGFILEYLADAAAKCGDVERAERWLHEAQRLRTSAGGGANQRIRASILARQGRDDEAEAIYRSESAPGPVILEHARFLESRGRMDEAVEQYARAAAGMSGDRPAREFVNAADRWWAGLSKPGRLDRIRSTLDGGPESILGLLRHYQSLTTREEPQPRITMHVGYGLNGGGFQISNLKFQILVALLTAISSPPLEGLSLKELAEQMEVENMSLWSRFPSFSRSRKQVQLVAWKIPPASAVLRGASSLIVAFRNEQARRVRASRLASLGLVSVVLATSASSANGQCTTPPCFQGLGDLPGGTVASEALGISRDGTTIVGDSQSENGLEAFRWRAATGMVGLGDLPGGSFYSWAKGLSADGNVVIGESMASQSGCGLPSSAFRWTEAQGMVELASLPGENCTQMVRAISDDASMIGGVSSSSGNPYRAAIWENGNVVNAGLQGRSAYYHLSGDGRFAAGWIDPNSTGQASALLHDRVTGAVSVLGDLPGGAVYSIGWEVNDAGTVVVGTGSATSGFEAFYWTSPSGMLPLGDFAGGGFESAAIATNSDGSIFVGYGTDASGSRAAIWRNAGPIEHLQDVLIEAGVSIPVGWVLQSARDITVNGNVVTVCGSGTTPLGNTEAWIARYTLPTPCTTPPCFQGLGDLPGGSYESSAGGIAACPLSSDGTTVVGSSMSQDGPQAFRWTPQTGMVGLGDLPGGGFASFARTVNANGLIVGGGSNSSNSSNSPPHEAFSWDSSSGMLGLGVPVPFTTTYMNGMSDDGNVQVGGEPAWYRIGAGPILPLASPGGSHWNAYAVSRTGSHAVGGNFTGSEWTAIRWSISGGIDMLGDLSGGATNARAWAVSADGAIVVGYGTSAAGTEAFRWTQATGMVALGDLPGGATSSSASAISADGTIIVGSGSDGTGSRAVAWIDSDPAAPVSDLLSDNGVSIPAGWVLTNASGVTTNGNIVIICGNGTNPSGNPEAWIARYTLPPACDPADVVQSPNAATAPFGGSVQLQVMAGGTGPITYQWRKNNVPLTDGPVGCGGTISGATTDTLVLNTVTFVEGGDYDCVVTNACGTDASTAATLTINPPPAAADVNHDGQVNGADIQAMVNALLAP